MSQRALICVVLLLCLKMVSVNAQVPDLDPTQTVNPATGEMGFALPLATVEGINGNNFPITLNYKAGIRLSDPSSSVGLGFGCGVGSITRQVVYVPDDNTGGRDNYLEGSTKPDCVDTGWWWSLITILEIVLFLVVAYLCSVVGGYIEAAVAAATSIIMKLAISLGGLAICAAISLGSQVVMYSVSMIFYSPADFTAGGEHVPAYNPGPIESVDHGRGIFKGSIKDLPDVYFVNTPIISGLLVYAGPGDGGYYFRFQQTGGSGGLDNSTIKAHYNVNSEEFVITMQNGMKLFFGGSADYVPRFNYESGTYGSKISGSTNCHFAYAKRQYERIPSQWMLKKITSPDFVDGNGNDNPTDSRSSNKGSWFYFTYYKENRVGYRNWEARQVMACAVQTTQMKDYFSEFHIANIYSPNQRASFSKSSSSKRDELWFDDSDEPINNRILLAGVTIFDKNNKRIKEIDFITDYELRKNHLHSLKDRYPDRNESEWDPVDGNDGAGCLRLKNIKVGYSKDGVNFNYLPPIKLEYVGLNPDGWNPRVKASIPTESDYDYYVEKRDVWGYYCPSSSTINDFNENGLKTRAVDLNSSEFPYAAAWSLQKIVFPTGKTIKWDYETQRYDRVNGHTVTSAGGAPKYCGGIRVKKVTAEDGLGGSQTLSYFYINPATPGTFIETNSNSSGYTSVEPYNYISDIDNRPTQARGGLYTPAKVGYEKVEVVKNIQGANAPFGYTVYEFTHAGDPAVAGYTPNLGVYGDIDCSWKRGLLFKTTQYDKNGKMVDSAFNEYAFISQDSVDYSYPDIENHAIGTLEYGGHGSSNYGWARLDSTVAIHMGVRKKEVFKYCDQNPSSKDYSRVIVPKSCMKYSSTSPTMSVELGTSHFKGCTRTAMIKEPGTYPNTAIVYVAEATSNTGPYDDDLRLQAISNVDITPGRLNMDNAQWSNVKMLSGMEEDGFWLLTGMDAIAYNDAEKNDLLLQFVEVADHANKVKLIILQNVRVEGVNIVCDAEIPLLVVFNDHGHIDGYPYFQTSSSSNPSYMDGQGATCSAVCNLDGGPIDIILYYADHEASYIFDSHNPRNFYVLSDIDLHTKTSWRNELNGYTYNTITYDYSKSVRAHIIVQDPNGHNPQIGYHACFLDLDNDGKQNDWVATDMYQENGTWRTTINDVVIKNIAVNPATKTFTIPPTVPALGQTIHIVKPTAGNFSQTFPLSSKTNTFGLVTPGDLSMRIYPFHFPVGATTIRTLLYGTYKAQVDADLDGQPNEVWSTAPQNKCLVTKTVPTYWKYNELGIPSAAQPNNKHMLTSTCQKIVYAGPEVTGSLLREYWLSISGSSVDDFRSMLYSRPDAVDELTAGGFFDCPTNFADNYGERIRGYITAPTTGSYTFWIASDDNSELWLSLDENPGNLKKIASITGSIWTGHNVWNAYPSQQSCPINLAGGKRYYIEVLHKEGTGGDNLSVGWQGPGITGDAERPIPLSRFTPLPTPKNVVSSQATTWSNSSGTWQPGSSYSWNVAMNSSGLPTTPLIDFNFATPSASNAAWKFIGSIEKYDNFSTPLETKNGKGIYSTTIYRNDVHLPIAAVANSKYDECAVYTCDHDIDNGWEKGSGCSMSVTKKHFGDSSVYVNRNYGPTKNITGFSTAKGYIFSAWVYPLDGNKISLNVEKRIGGVYSGNFGKDYTFTADKQNKWNLINVSITPAQLTGMNPGSDYLRIHVSCNPGNNTQFYVDDIRFYPKNALVTTTYYDSKWYQPILSVDANNNPSQKVEYDDFGRPVRWYKFDKNTTGLTPLQEKEYHLRSELNEGQSVQVLYPDCGGGVFYAGNKIDVSWVQSTTGTSRIKCVRPDNSIVCEIANENFSSGINVYEWEIPIAAVGDCKIQATAPDNSTDESDRIFTVRNESAITLTNIAAAGSGNHLEINWDGYDGNAGSTIKYNVLIKQEERSCVDMPPVCRWLPMSTLLNETRIEPGTTNTHSVTTNNFIGQIIPDHYQCALTITAKNDRGIVSTKMLITKVGSQYQLIPYP